MNDVGITYLREKIDSIDAEITALLNKRLDICRQIGQVKKALEMSVLNENIESARISRVKELSEDENKAAVETVYKEIIEECRNVQE